MTIGSVTISILAKTGSFETDMARAAKTAQRRAKEIDDAMSKAGTAVGAALSAAGIAAVYFGKQLVDGLDALNDVKDATGASIKNLSALEDVALRTGSNMDSVSSILVKFNNVLKEADGKNAASQTLKDIGLNAEELKRIDPAEALRQTAVALSAFADDGDKARAVQELFGKSVKDAAPFLKDLAEQTELVGKVTAEQAQAAEDFNKTLASLQKTALDLARDIAGPMVKSINDVAQAFRDGRAAGKGFLEIGLENGKKNYTGWVRDFWGMTPPSTGGASGSWGDPIDTRPSVPAPSGDPPKKTRTPRSSSAAPRESELLRYVENLQKQLDKIKELTTAETVLADLASGRLKLQKGESAEAAIATAKQIDALKAQMKYEKGVSEGVLAKEKALLDSATRAEEQATTLDAGNKALRDEIELIGKGAEAQAVIEAARLSSTIALKEEELARKSGTAALERELDALEDTIKALKERQELVQMKGVAQELQDEAKKTEDFAKDIGSAFSQSFERAIFEAEKLEDVLKSLAKSILATTLRKTVTDPLSASLTNALTSAFGGGGGYSAADQAGLDGLILGIISGKKASGGPVSGGKTYLVGEQGPELFTPNTSGKIIPNHAMGGGGQAVNVVINNTVGDVASLAQVRQAQAGTERRIAGMIGRSQRYGGALA